MLRRCDLLVSDVNDILRAQERAKGATGTRAGWRGLCAHQVVRLVRDRFWAVDVTATRCGSSTILGRFGYFVQLPLHRAHRLVAVTHLRLECLALALDRSELLLTRAEQTPKVVNIEVLEISRLFMLHRHLLGQHMRGWRCGALLRSQAQQCKREREPGKDHDKAWRLHERLSRRGGAAVRRTHATVAVVAVRRNINEDFIRDLDSLPYIKDFPPG